MAQTLAKGLSVVYGVDGDDVKTDQFTSFVRDHYALATGTMLASGAAGAYIAREYAGFGWPAAAGIGVASAAVGLLGASLAYMDRPILLKYHPWIAGVSFFGTMGATTVFLTSETAGLINVPTAAVIGTVAGLAVVMIESAAYNYWFNLIPGAAAWLAGTSVVKGAGAVGETIGNSINDVLQTVGLQDPPIDLDAIIKSGTEEQKALAQQIKDLMFHWNGSSKDRDALIEAKMGRLKELLGHGPEGPDPDADAHFTDNQGNPESNVPGVIVEPRPEFKGEPFKGELSEADLDGIANNGPPGIRALARSTKAALLRAQASNAQGDIDAYNKLVAQLRMELARNNADLEDQMDD
jgi:hypothetical protein